MTVVFRRYISLVSCSLLLLAACAAKPVLQSRSALVPGAVDFSGFWRIRDDHGIAGASSGHAVRDRLIPTGRSSRSHGHSGGSKVSVQVFLEYGELLKITQTDFGIFISYDRSVVEEFTFGENRLEKIGPIEAQRVSGWDGRLFVVETLDKGGTKLFESWRLENDNTVLIRDIRISKGEKETFSQRQVFERQ